MKITISGFVFRGAKHQKALEKLLEALFKFKLVFGEYIEIEFTNNKIEDFTFRRYKNPKNYVQEFHEQTSQYIIHNNIPHTKI